MHASDTFTEYKTVLIILRAVVEAKNEEESDFGCESVFKHPIRDNKYDTQAYQSHRALAMLIHSNYIYISFISIQSSYSLS